jgi:spermidine synthase
MAVVLAFHSNGFNLIRLAPGSRIAAHSEGVMAAVTVVEDSHREYHLKVNNKFLMGGTTSGFSDGRQGHIPLLLHPNPHRALFLGLGTGATFAAAADYPGLKADGVELVPEIIRMLPYFEKVTGPLHQYPDLKIQVADARRFVKASQDSYDVIVADLFHPARDGAGFLYTAEHFGAIQSRLAPGGIFCQWLPLYQMDLNVLSTIIRTFLHVFPGGVGFLATYSLQTPILGLIAGDAPLRFDPDYLGRRLASGNLHQKLRAYRLTSFYSLFGCLIAGAGDLAAFAGDGPLNTDDRPTVVFQAPRFVYSANEPAYVRLLALVERWNPSPHDIVMNASTPDNHMQAQRLAAYWRARNMFLHAGVGIRQTGNVKGMLAQVREPLLAVVRESPDFEAAYYPLIVMAQRLYPIDPAAAEALLIDLDQANPLRGEAR